MTLTPAESQTLLKFAMDVIVHRLQHSAAPDVPTDNAFAQPAGCFVSLHTHATHLLRGCVGRMDATRPLAEGVRDIAASVLADPRFTCDPVTLAELPELDIEISILGPLRPAANALAFDPPTEGIHLTLAGRTGVFLPIVARETGWTREQLLARLCTEKLGLPADTWRLPEVHLQVFSTVEIGPVPFAI